MDEHAWKIVCDWSARIHQWAEEGLSPCGLTCAGIRAPLAYVVYEDRVEPVTFPVHQEQTSIQHLRDRVGRGDGLGVVWVSQTKMKGVLDGETRAKLFDALMVCTWGGQAQPTRFQVLAQGFERKKDGSISLYDPQCVTGDESLTVGVSEMIEGSWRTETEGRA